MGRPDFQIRDMGDADAHACRMLLPDAFRGPEPETLVAVLADGTVAGAAATLWIERGTPPGFPIRIEVRPDQRRRGIASALLAAARSRAEGETAGLWAWDLVSADAPWGRFLAANRFAVQRRVREYRGETVALASMTGPLLQRLRGHGRIPAGMRVISLGQADRAAVATLVQRELGDAAGDLARRIETEGGGIDMRSPVLLAGTELVGTVLMRVEAEPIADAIAVAPDHRRGWAQAALLDAIAQLGLTVGAPHYRFIVDDGTRDIVNLARRARAEQIDERCSFYAAAAPDDLRRRAASRPAAPAARIASDAGSGTEAADTA